MKRNYLLAVLFLFIASALCAQPKSALDSLKQQYEKYPQQALREAEKIRTEALRRNDKALFLEALFLKIHFTLQIDSDQYPAVIEEVKKCIAGEQELSARSILHACLAQLYREYYDRNRYKIAQRTALEGHLPESIEEWSPNLFEQHILEELTASIAPAEALQATPIGRYRAIYAISPAEDTLRPTLYDHLCHEAIETMPSPFREVPDSIAMLPALLGNAEAFLGIALPETGAPERLRIWQQLLRFRATAGNAAAFVLADLERLNDTHNIYEGEDRDTLYLNTLEEMRKAYADLPISVEIIAQEAEWLSRHLHDGNALANNERALALCEEGIRKFPNYPRINRLHTIISHIKQPGITVRFPQTIYPGEAFDLYVNSRNLTGFTLDIYRIDTTMEAFQATPYAEIQQLPRTLVRQKSYQLSSSLLPQDTTVSVKGLPAGFYWLKFSAPHIQKPAWENVVCTALFAYQRTSDKENLVRVCDLNSGKPVKGATVRIYNRKYPASQLLDSVLTDARGFARLPLKGNLYQVTDARNPAGELRYFNKSYHPSPKKEDFLEIITDRQIYRPGQTVYYKGIAWKAGTDTIFARTDTPFSVSFYGANHELLDKQDKRSNAFGSFTGSFTIPAQTMNGSFRIEADGNVFFVQVAEYKRPEFEITFIPQEKSYRPTDTIRVKGKIMTFSGIRLDNVPIRYEIEQSEFWTRRGGSTSVKGITTTNAAGEFEWSFPADLIPPGKRSLTFYAYDITVQATDPKGETQSAQTQVIVRAGEITPQLEVPEQVDKQARTAFVISLKSTYSDNAPQTVGYTIARLAAPSKLSYPVAFTDTTVLETILQKEITVTGSDTIFPALTDQPSGAYLWSVTCNGKTSKQIFYLYSPEDRKPPIPTYNWLVAEKTRCRPGEKARILFGTSVPEAHVLYEVFAPGRLIKREFFTLSDEIKALEIPYLAEYGSRIWVSLIYVKHKNIIRENIPIDRIYDNRRLTVETGTFRDKLVPGQEEEWTLRILDESGKPVKAEVLAMMYDASLDQLYRNPIDFAPDYLLMSLYQRWDGYYWPKSLGYAYPHFKSKYYPVPSFDFIQVGYFEKRRAMDYGFADFDAAASGILQETAITAKQVQASGNALSKSLNAAPRYAIKVEAAADEAGNSGGSAPLNYRQNFAETAFFYPQLLSDSAGQAGFRFKVPESNTRWRFIALATTPSVATGKLEEYITTSKPLMVRPNFPRFLRSGDRTALKVTVSNLSDSVQAGKATLTFFLPQTNETVYTRSADFRVAAGENQTLTFLYDVPRQTDLLGCRISAASGSFSDGEQQLLAVLPDEIPVTVTAPFYSDQAGTFTASLPKDISTRNAFRLTLEVTANPIWYAVMALPSLQEPQQESVTDIAAAYYVNTIAAAIARANPKIAETIRQWQALQPEELQSKLSQNPELKSILLSASPWALEAQSETEQMKSLGSLFDQNRLDYLQQQALRKLSELQHPQGGWCWFKGMPANRFMTMNVLAILAYSTTTGQHEAGEQEKQMQIKALAFLDKEMQEDYKRTVKDLTYGQLLYLYTRSLYRDIPLGDAREAHKHLMGLARKQWGGFSLYEKAIAALVFHRYGFPDDARDVLRSLKEYAKTTPEDGMFWPENRNTFYRNSAVQTHAAIMEAFHEIAGDTEDTHLMKQWLLRQKQTQAWGSVPSTVDAIHALLLTGKDWLSATDTLTAQLGKHRLTTSSENAPLGYLKKSFSAAEIRPDMLTVRIDKTKDTPAWGSLYLQYFEKIDRIRSQKNVVGIEKKLFVEQTGKKQQAELHPLGNKVLKTGDKVIVRLTFTLSRDIEFLHLQDLRAACFEPVEQLSGTHWKFGTVYYQDVKDAVTNFFFTSLPRGTYVLEYPVWVNQAGEYQDGIATFQSVYAPEYNANSQATVIRVDNE